MRPAVAVAFLLSVAACAAHRPHGGAAGADHALVGRFWDVREARWVDEAAVEAAVTRADFALLGETHDNPDHHRLQARMLRAIIAAGRRPAVAFEMLNAGQQGAVDEALRRDPRDPDALARAVRWSSSGWPDFALYRPIFAAALGAGLPIVATDLSRERAREVVSRGVSVLEPPVRAMLERQGPLPEDVARAYREEMYQSHCRQLPESMLEPMVLMQRARDAEIAYHVLEAGKDGGAVLIAGTGHVRNDRAVPAYLAHEAPGRTLVAIGFLEVSPGEDDPARYAAGFATRQLPFDFVGFTVREEREDPCIGIEKKIRPIAPEPKDAEWVRR
jgi:uncharacterized iron-regulated protein